MTEWPTNYEDLKESLRNTRIPVEQEEAFREKMTKHLSEMSPTGIAKEEEHTIWAIFESRILSPSAPPPAEPLSL